MATATLQDKALLGELELCCERARVPRIRSLRQFVESEIIIPEGQYRGLKLRIRRQPYAGLLFDAIDSRQWTRFAIMGPVQSGKTLHGFIIPLLYHLFEYNETVICGVPQMDMAKDKWRDEIRPAIEASRFREFLPRYGVGSRGGMSNLESIKFRNGAVLKFMSGHGRDEKRSAFTSRVVIITEVDKMDTAGIGSREADPISQLESRMLSYADQDRRLYLECTVSILEGRIYQEYKTGTASRIAGPCPHCGEYVTPEREHLHEWQEAPSKLDARGAAWFACPSCGEQITESERADMNQQAVLVHRGQTIDKAGTIEGDPPKTDTLGFRWSGFNNLFWAPGTIGAKEWVGSKALDEENAEKELRQFWWAIPYELPELDTLHLDVEKVKRRFGLTRSGIVPADAQWLTMGIDVHQRYCYWILVAWSEEARGHIVDYNTFEVPSKGMDLERAIVLALDEFRDDIVMEGWPTLAGEIKIPSQVWVDAGWQNQAVYEFIRNSDSRFRPAVGRGAGQQYALSYSQPKSTGAQVKFIGDNYHFSWQRKEHIYLAEVNSDYWKAWIHKRLSTPVEPDKPPPPGALTFFRSSNENEHTQLVKQLTAEEQEKQYVAGKGYITKWTRLRRKNHWFDTLYNAGAAAHFCGVRLMRAETPTVAEQPQATKRLVTPRGEPYLITERQE